MPPPAIGVLHCFCAGLGVMWTKSEKSKLRPGVFGNGLPPPGVVIIDDGRASLVFLGGGVEGGSILLLFSLRGLAGEGDAAR